MYSFKENSHLSSSLHFKTPYSRANTKRTDPTVSRILTKQRTTERSYERILPVARPGLKNAQFRHYEAPSTSYADIDDLYVAAVPESMRECETGHFQPRKVHLGTLPLENNFDRSLELKTTSVEDAAESWETSKRQRSKPQETSPKGFQTKPRQNLLRVFTGSVENILHWSKLKNNHQILFEVTSTVMGVEQGKWKAEKIFYLSDSKSGPKLQVLYQEIDRSLPRIFVHSLVTCIGRLITRNRLQAYKIEETTEEHRNDLQRVSFICNRVADELVAASQPK